MSAYHSALFCMNSRSPRPYDFRQFWSSKAKRKRNKERCPCEIRTRYLKIPSSRLIIHRVRREWKEIKVSHWSCIKERYKKQKRTRIFRKQILPPTKIQNQYATCEVAELVPKFVSSIRAIVSNIRCIFVLALYFQYVTTHRYSRTQYKSVERQRQRRDRDGSHVWLI